MSIPKGATKLHLYDWHNVLRPRGCMEKESLGLYINERLNGAYEDWTDPDCGDNPTKEELISQMKFNMISEMLHAWESFEAKINK